MLAVAGDVTITGGTAPEHTCTDLTGNFDYFCDVVSATAFEQGDLLEITAPGGSFPSFQITTEVPVRPQLTTDTDTWTTTLFDGSSDVPVEWTPASSGSHIELIMSTEWDERLFCVTDDDGRFDIPAASIAEISGSFVREIHIMMTRVNETTIRQTADSVFTGRFVSSTSIVVSH